VRQPHAFDNSVENRTESRDKPLRTNQIKKVVHVIVSNPAATANLNRAVREMGVAVLASAWSHEAIPASLSTGRQRARMGYRAHYSHLTFVLPQRL
jgi:hypothetical protein